MICENCSVEIKTLMDQVNHVCPKSFLSNAIPLPDLDIDDVIRILIQQENELP